MIQRIQTIYLLLSIICLGLVFAFPFATYPIGENTFEFNVFGFEVEGSNQIKFPFYASVALSIGLSLFTIAQFKKRTLQLKLGRFNYLTILITLALSFINVRTIEDLFPEMEIQINFGIGLFLPVASLAFLFLANRAIKNDEKLIKSIDRIR